MKQEYSNCKLGLTPQCPKFNEPVMRKMIAPIIKAGNNVDTFNNKDLDSINELCAKCNMFIPLAGKE